MAIRVPSATVLGIEAQRVDVEADFTSSDKGDFTIVGLPNSAVRESRDRVRCAIKNAGYPFPFQRVIVNLAPADLRKEGGGFDLPIAVAILSRMAMIPTGPKLREYGFVGELSLDGRIKGVKGMLSIATGLARMGLSGIICSKENAKEAALIRGIEVLGVETLPQVVAFLQGRRPIEPATIDLEAAFSAAYKSEIDMSEVQGQEHAKRALEVAAAGGHNVLMIGPPGSGKTMLAHRLTDILPRITVPEALEATMVHSVAGTLGTDVPVIARRVFTTPHHSISDVGLVGGGTVPKPGQISLAHNGVLFLDELPEFKRGALEVMRQPMEDGKVTITRSMISVTYPADFMLVAAMNPCPCGFLGDPHHHCRCSLIQIEHYRRRISGPLLDRIDIHIEVPAIRYRELTADRRGERSAKIRERVDRVRDIQLQRFGKTRTRSNAGMTPAQVRRHCGIDADGHRLMEMVIDRLGFSARAHSRILKVARTIADLDRSEVIRAPHLSEAVQYRTLDRNQSTAA
jgi:magnesium chelatase family protein